MSDTLRPASYYVAPDPDTGEPYSLGHFNALVIRPEYKLKLKHFKEDMNLLFPGDPAQPLGKKTRLQALSYFPLKVDHADSDACLGVAWKWFKEHEVAGRDAGLEAKCIARLAEMLGDRILDGGALPDKGSRGKIYLHGGYPMADDAIFDTYFAKETIVPKSKLEKSGGTVPFKVTNRWEFETVNLRANDGLGKIPIVAQVEERHPGGAWGPARGVTVYFQLIPPDMPQSEVGVNGAGKAFVDAKCREDMGRNANDPQQENVSKERGGKRGYPVGGEEPLMNIFETGVSRPGFNVPPAGWGAQIWKDSRKDPAIADVSKQKTRKEYPPAATVGDPKIPHAVRNVTNEDGETGVVFMPSRVGGDRYRIRAFVGPPTVQSLGLESELAAQAAVGWRNTYEHIAETGVFEVWRTARVSQVFGLSAGTEAADLGRLGREFRKGFMELYLDVQGQSVLPQIQWRAAYDAARRLAIADTYNFLWPEILLPANPPPGTVDWVPLASISDYNAAAALAHAADPRKLPEPGFYAAPFNAGQRTDTAKLVKTMIEQMMKQITQSGYIPGLTIVRAERRVPDAYFLGTGVVVMGTATSFNGAYTWYESNPVGGSDSVYYYSDLKNKMLMQETLLHEVGHVWLLRHQHTNSAEGEFKNAEGGYDHMPNLLKIHEMHFDDPKTASGPHPDRICLMSYHVDNAGLLCGKCILSMRGWDAIAIDE